MLHCIKKNTCSSIQAYLFNVIVLILTTDQANDNKACIIRSSGHNQSKYQACMHAFKKNSASKQAMHKFNHRQVSSEKKSKAK